MQLRRGKKLPAQFVLAKNYSDPAQLSLRASRDGADLIHCCLSRINVIIIRRYARRPFSLFFFPSLSKSPESIVRAEQMRFTTHSSFEFDFFTTTRTNRSDLSRKNTRAHTHAQTSGFTAKLHFGRECSALKRGCAAKVDILSEDSAVCY